MPRWCTRVHAYVCAVAVLAIAVACLDVHLTRPPIWSSAAILMALALLGHSLKIRGISATSDLSINSIVILAAIPLIGPLGTVIVGALPCALELSRTPIVKRVYNTSMLVLFTSFASVVYAVAGGETRGYLHPGVWRQVHSTGLLEHLVLPLVLAHIAICLGNAVLLALVVAIDQRLPYREVFVLTVRGGGLANLGYGLFGVLLAVLWGPAQVGPVSALLVLAPLMVARWTYAQYAEENAAHERALRTLVGAVETKDLYTRGHSERVAEAAQLIGRALGLPQERVTTLRFAGLLHDVGKIGVPTEVLRKSGPLTEDEFASIALHPVRGLEMIRDIEFLGEALAGILHHHERLDGRGYPMGLSGTAIPEFARILAVADAFDSMTSTRSYRGARSVEEALVELRRCTGSQFDEVFVAALERALQSVEWTPTVTDPAPDIVAARMVDHDDPAHAPIGRPGGQVRAAASLARRGRS